MPYSKNEKMGKSNTKGSGTVSPAYPPKASEGVESPEGYQKEHRDHSPSNAGTKLPFPKRG